MNESVLRAFSYNGALDAGMDPGSYAWQSVPVGDWAARLDSKSGRIPRPPGTLSVTLPPWMMANDTVSRHFDRKMTPVVIPQKMVVLTFLKVGWMGKSFW
ncbi:TPA: hypothetical protein SLN25_002735 [Serratia marcescens]|uniref:hypothetical protein n=1 Tax=Serratia marcescens TaxID=615 RepID=UPI0029CEB074|nr:hypothetical protein [Serratia marcescens]